MYLWKSSRKSEQQWEQDEESETLWILALPMSNFWLGYWSFLQLRLFSPIEDNFRRARFVFLSEGTPLLALSVSSYITALLEGFQGAATKEQSAEPQIPVQVSRSCAVSLWWWWNVSIKTTVCIMYVRHDEGNNVANLAFRHIHRTVNVPSRKPSITS